MWDETAVTDMIKKRNSWIQLIACTLANNERVQREKSKALIGLTAHESHQGPCVYFDFTESLEICEW